MKPTVDMPTRRRFLSHLLAAGAGGAGLLADPSLLGLWPGLMAAPAGDYKALVCIFLLGGNDGHNLVVPTDPVAYAQYAQHRRGLTIPREHLIPLKVRSGASFAIGLHPQMPELANLFDSGEVALLGNLGALVQPVTRADYDARRAVLPPHLFSHNDQQAFWEGLEIRSSTELGAPSGWGGRIAEMIDHSHVSSAILPWSLSMAGSHLFPSGAALQPLFVATGEVRALDDNRGAGANRHLLNLLGAADPQPLVEHYRRSLGNAVGHYATLADVLAQAPSFDGAFPPPPLPGASFGDRAAYDLGQQLRRVAQLIERRGQIGHGRQVFFCALGGFDTHDAQSVLQPQLLRAVSRAMSAFDTVTRQLGMHDRVTSFTATEFGRSLTSNGDGSDHSWGNHLLAMGGAVRGGHVYGDLPALDPASPAFAGDGNLIPTTSVDQYAATLARWFGLGEDAIAALLPRLGNFDRADLGFLPG